MEMLIKNSDFKLFPLSDKTRIRNQHAPRLPL